MKRLLLLFIVCVYSTTLLSQDITNTLGTNGLFSIKDGSTTFFSLTQSDGYLSLNNSLVLPNSSNATAGIIFKGSDKFIHNYGTLNTFMGVNSGNFTLTGNSNTAIGYQALIANGSGSTNTAVGVKSLNSNISGGSNTAMGANSLYFNTSGSANTAIGYYSLFSNNIGYDNVAVGMYSMQGNTSGHDNVALGYYAGANITTGNNLTCIGPSSQPTTGSATNQITLGNSSISSLRCNVTTITSLSDRRDKKNIIDLTLGLEFITKLKPRQYNWDKREWYTDNKSDGTRIQETPTAGFIAQELDSVQSDANATWLNLVLKDNPDKWEATPGNLLPIIVKAIQELKKENDELKIINVELKDKLNKYDQMQNILASEITKLKLNNSEIINVSLGEK